jgi:hypothetical protein
VDPSIRKGIRRRSDWIRRSPPGVVGDYVRLNKKRRDRVDALFLAERKLKPGEVTSLVERLYEEKLSEERLRRRARSNRSKALASMRRLRERPKYKDETVVRNNARMSPQELALAAASSVDELTELARDQTEGNPFWYH